MLHGCSDYEYLGLGSDNRLLRVNALHVVGWLEGEEGTLPPEAAEQVDAALGKAVGWAKLASELAGFDTHVCLVIRDY